MIQQFENHPNRNLLVQDFNKTEEVDPLGEESKDLIGQYGDLRAPRDFFEETMLGLRFVLGSWHRVLHMRQMPAAYRKESTDEQRKIRRVVNPWLCHQKKNPSWCRHGPSMRRPCTSKHKICRGKPAATRVVIVGRFWNDGTKSEQYRKSLSDNGWTERTD